jgi:pimeloyl-ACP methyl ester carboxylesterase
MLRVAVLVIAGSFFGPSSLSADQGAKILTIDHLVPHVSTVPANAGDTVNLFVRERVRSDRLDENPRKAVLMIHGASVPVLPGMDLAHDDYSWARWLAQAGGLDVFMLDFQGSGQSPRPKMDDPCNAPAADQARALIPNPLSASCPPSYPFQLINSQSDWDELDAVVDYIRRIRGVDKVALVSWSQGSFRAGPYAVQHPEKVESLLFYSPIFNPAGRAGTGPDGFGAPIPLNQPGTPMTLRTRGDLMRLWEPEIKCEGQVEEGILDVIWGAIMESDPIGRTWGLPPAGAPEGSAPEGVMRVRSNVIPLWGWNPATAHRITVPVLIIAGEFDLGGGGVQDFPRLYNEIPHPHKLWFKVQCAGHSMVWERQRKVLHHISKEWLKQGTIAGYTEGKFCVDNDGVLSPQVQDPQTPPGTCEWAVNP